MTTTEKATGVIQIAAGVRYPCRRWRCLHAGLLQRSLLPFSEFALLLLVVTNGLKRLHILTDDPNILFYVLNLFSDRRLTCPAESCTARYGHYVIDNSLFT